MKGKIKKKNQFNIMTQNKTKNNKKNKAQIKKKLTYYKFEFNDEIENKPKFYKRAKNKN